ncbi:hypothetical protein ACQEU5_19200 [Marinactinospora thermotolerans]|uniref:hypothetical protein n=1 Tax=Marinactinospora thermotolerans TaxID=531310 RepID=UPI003D8ED1B4
MCTDRRRVVGALPMTVALAVALWTPPAFAAAPAAAPQGGEQGRTEQIVSSLRESPIYVDPSYASAMPEEQRRELAEDIQDSGVPLYVIMVPLIHGGAWQGDAGELIAAVHDRLGVDEAHYLVTDQYGLEGEDITHGSQDPEHSAFYAAMVADNEADYDGAVAARVERAVEVTLSGEAEEIYDRLSAEALASAEAVEEEAAEQAAEETPEPSEEEAGGDGTALWWGAAALLALLAFGGAFLVWRRRARRPSPIASAPVSHAAFDNAEHARLDGLAERIRADLVEVGERLSATTTGDRGGPEAVEALRLALDAHAAAGAAYDAIGDGRADLADAAGALVLLDVAEDAMARARALDEGRVPAEPRAHCYANPLHGTRTTRTRWRALGERRSMEVPLCAECARRVNSRLQPDALRVEHEGHIVPYYEVPAEQSVWSATGFGALRDDLVARITRGDLSAS